LDKPAAVAAARVARAGGALGVLGLLSSVFVLARLVETWRVTSNTASHQISLLGHMLSYPAANFAAVVVLGLAIVGLTVTAMIVWGAAREFNADMRFRRTIRSRDCRLLGDAVVIPDEQTRAFCAGLLKPRVYVSTGSLERLDETALQAVLSHERHHALRRDPLRLAAGRVITRALFFVPGLAALFDRHQALAELSADEHALSGSPEGRAALARAMLSFSDESDSQAVGIDPARVDYLLGELPRWRFPALLSLGAFSVLALVVAVAVLAGQVAMGSASLAPPFLSAQPCVVVLAMIPAVLGLLAVRLLQLVRRRS
jgi:BlaR1 peptidase M56